MIVTLTGENDAARSHELTRFVADFESKHGDMAIERLDGEEASFERMAAAVESLPFLVPRKLVVLRAPSQNKDFTERFEQFLDRIADTNDILIVESKLDKRLSYYKQLKKFTDFRDFAVLDAMQLASFAQTYASEQGGSISAAVARQLVERLGTNQLGLMQEIDKLVSYNLQITETTINLLTEKLPQSTVFALLEAAFAGDVKRTLLLYGEQRALKVEPQQIMAMLAWQLHIFALIKSAGARSVDAIAREAKLNPFVVRKSQNLVRRISLAQLKKYITTLRELDVRMKSESIVADEAVQYYLLRLSS